MVRLRRKKKIVALKFLVAVPAAYAFLRSKKDGKWYKLAPSTTGVMAKMFQVLKPVRLAPTTSDGPTACDDNPSGSQSEVPVEKTRLLRSSARSKVPAEKKLDTGGVPPVENLDDTPEETPDVSRRPASGSLAAPAALPADLPSPATSRTLW